MGLEDILRIRGTWSEPHMGPWDMWWWKGKDCLLERIRSGLPVPVWVKVVGKSGPRKRSRLRRVSWCSSCPCWLLVVCLNVVCLALKSASM